MPSPQRSSYLSWPPPGLEPIHGKLWPVIAVLGIGALVLVLPFLATLGAHLPFTSMGAFGRQWWIVLLTTAVGALILVAAGLQLVVLLWRSGQAAADGHGWRTILYALTDGSRDAGFLLQGARQFAMLSPVQRRVLLSVRLWAAGLSLAAVLLAPLGVGLSALLGHRGWTESGSVWVLSLWLPLGLMLAGGMVRWVARLQARTTRGTAHDQAAHAAALKTEIVDWNANATEVTGHNGPTPGATGTASTFRGIAIAANVIGALVVFATLLLAVAGSLGPLLMSIAVPRFTSIQGRALEAEVLEPYGVPTDSNITPLAAGQALHALLLANQSDVDPVLKVPVRHYDDPIGFETLPDGSPITGAWLVDQFATRGRGLTPAQRQLLRSAAAHPALLEFATIAAAPAVDIIGARYKFPLPDTLTPAALPIPRFGVIRTAAEARLAGALLDFADGRTAQAERQVREVIGTGLALVRDGPMLIDALIGTVIAREAGSAMDGLLRATGRAREADEVQRLREQTKRVTEQLAQSGMGSSIEAALEAMPRLATDTTVLRSLRWEFYVTTRSFGPCSNLHTMVFGPGEQYRTWVDDARRALVRWDSEERFFAFMGQGYLGTGGCLPILKQVQLAGEIH